MEKGDQSVIEPVRSVVLPNAKIDISGGYRRTMQKLENIFIDKGIALLIIAVLLGRALILSELSPFALPFFAVVYMLKRNKAPIVLFGLLDRKSTRLNSSHVKISY